MSLSRAAATLSRLPLAQSRSITSFAELYRNSVSSIPVQPGDNLLGTIVGHRRPRSTSARFNVLDFGLKAEAPFAARETPGKSAVGDVVSKRLLDTEDEFNEPSFDHDSMSTLPTVLAVRYRALTASSPSQPQFLYGRLSAFKRGGASTKVLGFDAFSPRHHVLAIQTPAINSYSPLYLLSLVSSKRSTASATALPGLDVNPVVSSYGGILFTLANLVGFDDAWAASGGGSDRERAAYLLLLTRVLYNKSAAVRAAVPRERRSLRAAGNFGGDGVLRSRRGASGAKSWLDDFPEMWQQRSAGVKAVRSKPSLHPGARAKPELLPTKRVPPRAGAENYGRLPEKN